MTNLVLGKADYQWIGFYALILLSWLVVFVMSVENLELKQISQIYGTDFWIDLCREPKGISDFFILLFMWIIMSAAMMIPTLQPALSTYIELPNAKLAGTIGFWMILSGFMAIWFIYCLFMAGFQAILLEFNIIDLTGSFLNPYLNVCLILFAGIYQFMPIKASCVSKCRSPLIFFMEHWKEGKTASFSMGIRLGLICLGCCWVLMTLAFVGGTMNLVFMGLGTLLMSLEKLPDIGRFLTWPLGIILFICAGYLFFMNLT